MPVEALILSRDPQLVRVFRRCFEEVGVSTVTTDALIDAQERITTHKFDAVIVDCDDIEGGGELLAELRKGSSNKNAIAYAVVNERTSMKQAYDVGANFVVEKPITFDRVTRSVRAGHGLIYRERRRYSRHPLSSAATLELPDRKEVQGSVVNVSEGGMAIATRVAVERAQMLRVRFTLDSTTPIDAKVEVAWVKEGQLGLKFAGFGVASKGIFDKWMLRQMEEETSKQFVSALKK